MKALLLCAGRFTSADRQRIAEGKDPRLDVFELQDRLGADVLDYAAVDGGDASGSIAAGVHGAVTRAIAKTAGPSAALAYLGFQRSRSYDAVFTTGEDIGLPYAALCRTLRGHRPRHTMIAHTMAPRSKKAMVRLLGLAPEFDSVLCYATTEERTILDLGFARERVHRIAFHADTEFFKPDPSVAIEPNRLCAAGQLLRDYDTLVEAVRPLDVKVQIAAGSPWIERPLHPRPDLPPHVSWGRLNRYELRSLYARSALCVVPLLDNDYQTGISTMLEMMAMGKCLVVTKTRGQIDTVQDGVNGVYVPPGDPLALRRTIERLLANPDEARAIGERARQYVLREASLELFVDRVTTEIAGKPVPARSKTSNGVEGTHGA